MEIFRLSNHCYERLSLMERIWSQKINYFCNHFQEFFEKNCCSPIVPTEYNRPFNREGLVHLGRRIANSLFHELDNGYWDIADDDGADDGADDDAGRETAQPKEQTSSNSSAKNIYKVPRIVEVLLWGEFVGGSWCANFHYLSFLSDCLPVSPPYPYSIFKEFKKLNYNFDIIIYHAT